MTLSIIIPTYNSSAVLRRAIDSIIAQTFSSYEILIMDGASQDETSDIVRTYGDPRIRMFSSPDKGIYDAMNKGIAESCGEWLYFLGSDDWLLDENVLQKVFATEKIWQYDVVYGDVEATHLSPQNHGEWLLEDFNFNRCHQAIFYKRRFIARNGGYSLKYPIFADYDLNLKWFLSTRCRSLFINVAIAHFSSGGASSKKSDVRFEKDKARLLLTRGFSKFSWKQRRTLLFNIFQSNATGRFIISAGKAVCLIKNGIQYFKLQCHKKLHRIDHPIVHLYATCWNEEKILPYLFSHYDSIVDKFFIYDNHSTDSSPELIMANKKAELRVYAPEKIDDQALRNLKNNCWKKSRGKADLVIVCDVDEFLYHREPSAFIRYFINEGYSVCHPQGYEMCSATFPKYAKGTMLTDLVRTGMECNSYSKCILFNPYRIININYQYGAHMCYPSGIIREYSGSDVKLLHYKKLGLNNVITRYESMSCRLSEKNIKSGLATHYQWDRERIRQDFAALMDGCSKVI